MAMLEKQKRFCEEYLKHFNATKAAKDAGYSEKTAYAIGWENLRKPEIRAYIDKLLEEVSLSSAETRKMLSDIARGNLSDYYIVKKVERTPRIEISLSKYIKNLEEEFAFEENFAKLAGYNARELKLHQENQKNSKRLILRHKLELKKNPKAKIIINGPTQWVEVAELDMVKLIADKEKGKIKSISPSQFGTKVELVSADSALVNLARIHGLFEVDNKQRRNDIQFIVGYGKEED